MLAGLHRAWPAEGERIDRGGETVMVDVLCEPECLMALCTISTGILDRRVLVRNNMMGELVMDAFGVHTWAAGPVRAAVEMKL